MSWRTVNIWYGENGVRVTKQKNSGSNSRIRFAISGTNETYLTVDDSQLYDLTELLDDICDELEDAAHN